MSSSPSPTDALRNLSLGGNPDMVMTTRAATASVAPRIVTSLHTGITYDLRELSPQHRQDACQGFKYVGKFEYAQASPTEDTYTFAMTTSERPGSRPEGAVRLRRTGNPRIGCYGSACSPNRTLVTCKHVFWLLDYLLSWYLRRRPFDPIKFNRDATFRGMPPPYDLIQAGTLNGFEYFLNDCAAKDATNLPRNRLTELEEILWCFDITGASDDPPDGPNDVDDEKRVRAFDSLKSVIVRKATQDPTFLLNLEAAVPPIFCTSHVFEQAIVLAQRALQDGDRDELQNILVRLQDNHYGRAENRPELAQDGAAAIRVVRRYLGV